MTGKQREGRRRLQKYVVVNVENDEEKKLKAALDEFMATQEKLRKAVLGY